MHSTKDMVQSLLDLGLTQTEIAAGAGVTQPTVSRALSGKGLTYENGKRIESFYVLHVKPARRKEDKPPP